MNFGEQKKRAAAKLNLLDKDTDTILTGRDITEDDLEEAINDGYLAAVQTLSSIYPHLFEVEAYTANYVETSTISSVDGDEVTVSDGIFTNGSIGAVLYNSTLSAYEKIVGYTSTTVVTLENDVEWETADAVTLLEKEYTFSSNITDLVTNLSMKVRYTPTGDYVDAIPRLYDSDPEDVSSSVKPMYRLKQVNASTGTVQGFEIYPTFTAPDTKAIYQRFVALPSSLSNNSDVPKLPLGQDTFLFWKGVEYGAYERKDEQLAALANAQFEKGLSDLINYFKPMRGLPTKMKPGRRYYNIFNHTR